MEKTTQQNKMCRPNSTDRLSPLPDDILCSILSYLPTVRSVQTSVLARRWRSLWAYVPSLHYQISILDHRNHSDNINKFMFSRESKELSTFYISGIPCTCHELETWIAIAILGNVRNLILSPTFSIAVPQCLFTCKTLVELILYDVCIPFIGDLVLPRLKKLHLRWVEYWVEDPLPRLLFGCPVLEELAFDETCHATNCGKDYSISSPTIKILEVIFGVDCGSYKANYILRIHASALRSLRVNDCCYKHMVLSQETMTSLAEATINIDRCTDCNEDTFNSEVKFLDSLSNVKCLTLPGHLNQKVNVQIGPTVKFNNLATLRLGFTVGWPSLVNLMEIADNLEVLKLTSVMGWTMPAQVPACVISNLKSISIYQMTCTRREFYALNYFLENAKVLEKMEIYLSRGECYVNISAVPRVISEIERGSNQCQVILTLDGVVYVS